MLLLAGVALAAIPLGLATFLHRPQLLLTGALLATFAAQTSFAASLSVISRLPILALLALAIKMAYDDRRSGQPAPEVGSGLRLAIVTIVGLAVATVAISRSPFVSIQAAIAVGALFVAALGIARFVSVDSLLDSIGRISATAVAGSLVLSPVLPDAYLGQRLSGIFRNPNSLGAAAIVACATVPARYLVRIGPILVLATVLSGSRSGALGIVAVLLVRIRWSRVAVLLALLAAPVVVVSVAAVPESSEEVATITAEDPQPGGPAILRTKNNRSSQWSQGLVDARASWPFGQGFGTSTFEYSNSALFLLVETGILVLPIGASTLALASQAFRHHDNRVAALVLSLLVHSQFEGWMFAFGSPQAFLFWLVVVVAARERSLRITGHRSDPPPAGPATTAAPPAEAVPPGPPIAALSGSPS